MRATLPPTQCREGLFWLTRKDVCQRALLSYRLFSLWATLLGLCRGQGTIRLTWTSNSLRFGFRQITVGALHKARAPPEMSRPLANCACPRCELSFSTGDALKQNSHDRTCFYRGFWGGPELGPAQGRHKVQRQTAWRLIGFRKH